MNRAQLEHAIRASGAISGDSEFFVVGSQSILGPHPDAHPELCRSMEVDIAPRNKPELEELIEGSIGELSLFHQTFGFYVDGIEIGGICLPEGWKERLVKVENANTNGYCGWCLAPLDLAVSKLAAGRNKDFAYVRVLHREQLISRTALLDQIDTTPVDPQRKTLLTESTKRCLG